MSHAMEERQRGHNERYRCLQSPVDAEQAIEASLGASLFFFRPLVVLVRVEHRAEQTPHPLYHRHVKCDQRQLLRSSSRRRCSRTSTPPARREAHPEGPSRRRASCRSASQVRCDTPSGLPDSRRANLRPRSCCRQRHATGRCRCAALCCCPAAVLIMRNCTIVQLWYNPCQAKSPIRPDLPYTIWPNCLFASVASVLILD